MTTRHALIDSPLGQLTLVATDDALAGLYFRLLLELEEPAEVRAARLF